MANIGKNLDSFKFECKVRNKYQLVNKIMVHFAGICTVMSELHNYSFVLDHMTVRPGGWADVVEVEAVDQWGEVLYTTRWVFKPNNDGWKFVEKDEFLKSCKTAEARIIRSGAPICATECMEDYECFQVAQYMLKTSLSWMGGR